MNLHELRAKRDKHVQAMRALTENPQGDGGDLSAEQAETFDKHKADLEQVERSLERAESLAEAERRMQGTPVSGGGADQYEQELRNFSFRKALAGAAGLDVDWGRERELGQECAKRMGVNPTGVMIPLAAGAAETRNVLTTDNPAGGPGGNLIATDHLGGQFIDLLRSRIIVQALGARMLTDLQGDVDIPGLSESAEANWFAENSEIPASTHEFRQVQLSPKHVGARTEVSRNMLLQSSPDIEQLVQSDFAAVIARAVDRAALNGTGGTEPTGILNRSGVTEVADFAATWEKIQELIGTLEDSDAEGSAFAATPSVVRTLRTTNRVDGEPEHGFIMESRDALDGYQVARSTHMAADKLLFGNFADVLIGMWGGVEILPNPYAQGSYEKGNVQYRIIQTVDVNVRRPESFAFGDLSAE